MTEFCKLWASPDPERLAAYFTEDGVYHKNRQLSDGNFVMNERTDVMRRTDGSPGGEVALPVTGVFEVVDGKIANWRDYFDLATVAKAFS